MAMAISVKEELALVVVNLGSRQGVKVGMPFQVIRGDSAHRQRARRRCPRENRRRSHSKSKFRKRQIKVGDRLKVDAQP